MKKIALLKIIVIRKISDENNLIRINFDKFRSKLILFCSIK